MAPGTSCRRLFSNTAKTGRDLARAQKPPHSVMVVKQVAKTSVNFVFVGGCVVLTGAIVYAITNALFGSTSPYKVLDSSFDIIKDDEEVR